MFPLDRYNGNSTDLPQKKLGRSWKIFRPKPEKNLFKIIISKCSCAEVECSYHKPADIFLPKLAELYLKFRKQRIFILQQNKFSSNDSSGLVHSSSDRFAPIIQPEFGNSTSPNPKKNENYASSFPQNNSLET